jgi:hypothetical protein
MTKSRRTPKHLKEEGQALFNAAIALGECVNAKKPTEDARLRLIKAAFHFYVADSIFKFELAHNGRK